MPAPVSYTHLDVYKRQGLNLEELSELTGISKSALGSYEKETIILFNEGEDTANICLLYTSRCV